jgi:hypothetical protein
VLEVRSTARARAHDTRSLRPFAFAWRAALCVGVTSRVTRELQALYGIFPYAIHGYAKNEQPVQYWRGGQSHYAEVAKRLTLEQCASACSPRPAVRPAARPAARPGPCRPRRPFPTLTRSRLTCARTAPPCVVMDYHISQMERVLVDARRKTAGRHNGVALVTIVDAAGLGFSFRSARGGRPPSFAQRASSHNCPRAPFPFLHFFCHHRVPES